MSIYQIGHRKDTQVYCWIILWARSKQKPGSNRDDRYKRKLPLQISRGGGRVMGAIFNCFVYITAVLFVHEFKLISNIVN